MLGQVRLATREERVGGATVGTGLCADPLGLQHHFHVLRGALGLYGSPILIMLFFLYDIYYKCNNIYIFDIYVDTSKILLKPIQVYISIGF